MLYQKTLFVEMKDLKLHSSFIEAGRFAVVWILCTLPSTYSNIRPDFVPNEMFAIARFPEGHATPVGTTLYRLKAQDRDGDPLTFSISTNRSFSFDEMFQLKPISKTEAVVTLSKEFDREKIPDFLFDVLVTDKRSPKPPILQMLFIISDVNDNSPKFRSYNSTVSIPESNTSTPFPIAKFWAEDTDEGPNGVVRYFLETEPEDGSKFNLTVIKDEAVLFLLKPLDFEEKQMYRISIVARDTPLAENETRETKATFIVKVVDEDDHGPRFVTVPPPVSLREDVSISTKVFEVKAIDGDVDVNGKINYELLSETDKFRIDSSSGAVYTTTRFDFDFPTDSFTLKIKAIEVESLVNPKPYVETSVVVNLVTVDGSPKFRNTTYEGVVPENSPPGYPIALKLGYIPEVYDNDVGGKSLIRLWVEGDGDTFEIVPSQGYRKVRFQLVVKRTERLDYERLQEIDFYLVAEDSSRNRTAILVSVRITDLNDNIPVFEKDNYIARIPENPPLGFELLKVKATDRDSDGFGNNGIRYPSLKGAASSVLEVNNITGVISVTSLNSSTILDRERQSSQIISVEAYDDYGKGQGTFAWITIELEDVNDNAPIFIQTFYQAEILENINSTLLPLQVSAIDADEYGTNNSRFMFEISGENDRLHVNSTTGLVHLIKPFDYEQLIGSGKETLPSSKIPVNFTLHVYDLGRPSLSSFTNLTILVTDENDCAPKFSKTQYDISIPENFPSDQEIVKVDAVDGDITPTYNRIIYQIINKEKNEYKFDINSETGIVFLAAGKFLDFNNKSQYSIKVKATDYWGLESDTICTVNVNVTDINNKSPTFIHTDVSDDDNQCGILIGSVYEASVFENTPENVVITEIRARDLDTTASLRYAFQLNNSKAYKNGVQLAPHFDITKYLTIGPFTGTLKSGQYPFDHEVVDKLKMSIIVQDIASETGLQMAQAWVLLHIRNENDNKPTFLQDHYTLSISENIAIGSTLIQITARGETMENSSMKYVLESPTHLIIPFDIESQTGVISVVNMVDRETTNWINFTVKAIDTKSVGQLSSKVDVFVKIEDENDNKPSFTDSTTIINVREDTLVGTVVGKVQAEDKDSGEFGKVAYFLDSNNDTFTIDYSTGMITLKKALDRELVDTYNLHVVAADNVISLLSQNVSKTIIVHVDDSNDQIPRLILHTNNVNRTETGEYSIPEDFNDTIIAFTLVDDDKKDTINSMVEATLSCDCNQPLFQLREGKNLTKFISPQTSLEGHSGNYTLTVTAKDGGTPTNIITTKFHVVVEARAVPQIDVKFDNKLYTSIISVGYKAGTELVHVATTRGKNELHLVTNMSITGLIKLHTTTNSSHLFRESKSLFVINQETGSLALNMDVDNEHVGFFEMNLTLLVNNTQLDCAKVLIHFVKDAEKLNLFSTLPFVKAVNVVEKIESFLENAFQLVVNVDANNVSEIEVNLTTSVVAGNMVKSVFHLSIVCPSSHHVLQAQEIQMLLEDNFGELVDIFKLAEIVSLNGSLSRSREQAEYGYIEDVKMAYLYLFIGVIFFLLLVYLITCSVWCCWRCKSKRKHKLDYDEIVVGGHVAEDISNRVKLYLKESDAEAAKNEPDESEC